MAIIVAVDAMGGDLAPGAVVAGAVRAARSGVSIVLVGPEAVLARELEAAGASADPGLTLVNAPEVIGMDEAPLAALRRKPLASVKVAAELVATGRAHAMFTAGHTGAAFLAAHAAIGMLSAVARAALAVTLPTRAGSAVLLDAGANADCRAEHLVQFALMGSAYARVALQIATPRVALLSIGEEAGKGNDLVRDAHERLTTTPLNFIGNLDARQIFSGHADVVVCDGFTGNVALKVGEGLAELVEHLLGEELAGDVGAHASLGEKLSRFRRRIDYAEHGAAPLLGLAGLALIGHGRLSPQAIESGILTAARLAEHDMVRRLGDALAEPSSASAAGA